MILQTESPEGVANAEAITSLHFFRRVGYCFQSSKVLLKALERADSGTERRVNVAA